MNYSKEFLDNVLYFEKHAKFNNYKIIFTLKEKNIFGFHKKKKVKYPCVLIQDKDSMWKDKTAPSSEYLEDVQFLRNYFK